MTTSLQARSRRGVELLDKLERIRLVLDGFPEERLTAQRELPWEIRTILSFIHANLFSSQLNAAAVRRSCSLRNNNISSRFRCVVGMGLKEYIEAARLEAARNLLSHPDLEIYLIAMSVGYDHHETFFRAFQRQYGCTPSEWRLRARWREEGEGADAVEPANVERAPSGQPKSEPETGRTLS